MSTSSSQRRRGLVPGRRLSVEQARRVALAAQGFGRPRRGPVTARQLGWVVDRVAQFQIDSVNVVARAAYLPLFSRLGAYDPALLDAAASQSPRRLFEYWGHEASLIDVRLWPALRVKMAGQHAWGGVERIRRENPGLLDDVLARIAAAPRGLTARELDDGRPRDRSHWGWNWSDAKRAAEVLFHAGEVTVARRNASFERVYARPERVLPAAVLAAPPLEPDEAHTVLAARALRARGVAEASSVATYFRLKTPAVRRGLDALVADGRAEPVEIAGLPGAWFADAAAARPRRVETASLVSPFDSVMFDRPRLAKLFGFDYRIEIYVPAEQRRYGYYVYPFLLDERFVARVDLKADRSAGVLLVRSAWLEPAEDADRVASALAGELALMATWLGLGGIAVAPRGDLAPQLARAVG